MANTKIWSVWHERDSEHKHIVVHVAPTTDGDDIKRTRDGYKYIYRMKFRTITARAAARRYIRNNLFGRVAKAEGCPCFDDWSDPVDRKKLKGGQDDAKKEYEVEIKVWKM